MPNNCIYVLVHLNRENGGLTYTSAGSKELVLVDILIIQNLNVNWKFKSIKLTYEQVISKLEANKISEGFM